MTTFTIRAEAGAAPTLIVDGEDVPPDSRITLSLSAAELARVLYDHIAMGAAAAYSAGVAAPAASDRRVKTVERDETGRIVRIVDEPIR